MSNVSIISKGPSCIGTKVLVDGVAMKGVHRIELSASATGDKLWHAVIHCHPSVIEVTDFDSAEVEWVKGKGDPDLPHLPDPMPSRSPSPPPFPPGRFIQEGAHWASCPQCSSTMMGRRWFFFGKSPGCIQPDCRNYGGLRRVGSNPSPPGVVPSRIVSR